MMRGYARLKAKAEGIELYPDHPLMPKQSNTLAHYVTRERLGALRWTQFRVEGSQRLDCASDRLWGLHF